MAKRVSNAKTKRRLAAKARGFRSGDEMDVADWLIAQGAKFDYESQQFTWEEAIANARCPDCGTQATARRTYTPDFFLQNGRIIEVKGRFTVKDRKIALAMRDQGVDISYLFMKNNTLSPKSTTRYTEWCEKHGLECALKEIPEEWLQR